MSQVESPFRRSSNGYFMEITGPAWYRKKPWYKRKGGCQKKLCFVATDQSLLAEALRQLAERPDCFYVKSSAHPRDGMSGGRCFLMDERGFGRLGAKFKPHPRLFCSVQ